MAEDLFPNTEQADIQERLKSLESLFGTHNHDGRNSLEVATRKVRESISAGRILSPSSLIAGTDLANGDVVRVGLNNQSTVSVTSGDDAAVTMSDDTDWCAMSFTPVANCTVNSVEMYGKCDTAGTTNASLHVYNDSTNTPGTQVTNASTGTIGFTNTSNAGMGGTFSTPPSLTGGTKYWVVMKWIGGAGNITLRYVNSDVLANQKGMKTTDGSTWANVAAGGNEDFRFGVNITETLGKVYKAWAVTSAETGTIIGIVEGTFLAGETPTILSFGYKTDYTNLTAGSKYYLTNTRGVIGTTAGTNTLQVGVALTTEVLKIII